MMDRNDMEWSIDKQYGTEGIRGDGVCFLHLLVECIADQIEGTGVLNGLDGQGQGREWGEGWTKESEGGKGGISCGTWMDELVMWPGLTIKYRRQTQSSMLHSNALF